MGQNALLYGRMNNDLQLRFNANLRHLQVDAMHLYLVAASGGLDSCVLCHLCHAANIKFIIVHCNFGLRGEESNRDEDFVKSLGLKYDAEVLVQHFDTDSFATENRLSIQEAARSLRYNWFEKVRIDKKAAYVLLAHHANDNLETALMHFFRGTGLSGLTGMPAATDYMARCLRPLLPFTRKEIETFAKQHQLQWVEDSSNALDKYIRNFFRNTLIPQLQQVYPAVEQNLLQNIERLQKTDALYQQLVQKEKQTFLKNKGYEIRISVKKILQYQHTSMLYEVLKDFGFGEKSVPELVKLAAADSGKFIESETHRIIRHRAWYIVARKKKKEGETFVLEKGDKKTYLADSVLQMDWMEKEHFHLKKSPYIAQLDARSIKFPLLVRRWLPGDYFYPLGMPKKKKLARFFIDQKLSATEKENIWVVESAGRIVWIAGHRIDDRFKVEPHTKHILQLQIESY